MTIAALFMLAIDATRRRASGPLTARSRLVLACAGGALAVHFATWIASLQYTPVAISTLLVATSPIWTALYDGLVRRKLLARNSLVAFVAGAIGLGLVVGFDRTAAPVADHLFEGCGLALIGALAFAVYLLLVRSVRTNLETARIVAHTYSWAALFLLVASVVAHQSPPALTNTPAWGGIIAMALISQLLGHTGMNAALAWFTPSAISFSTLLEPVFAAALALVLFSEPVPPIAMFGGALVLAAVAVVAKHEREPVEAGL